MITPVAILSRGEPWFFPVFKKRVGTFREGIQRLCFKVFGHDWIYNPKGDKRICEKCRRYEEACSSVSPVGRTK